MPDQSSNPSGDAAFASLEHLAQNLATAERGPLPEGVYEQAKRSLDEAARAVTLGEGAARD